MTLVDIVPILFILAYAAGGFFSGLIRRFIGLIALFVAVWAATNMGIQAGGNDTVVRNNSGANGGVAYGPTAGADWGPVGNASSTNPWTNF